MTAIMCEQIIDLDTGLLLGYFVKGYVKNEQLMKEIIGEWREDATADLGKFRQSHYRFVPCPTNEFCLSMLVESGPGRGAFPVTIFEFDQDPIFEIEI